MQCIIINKLPMIIALPQLWAMLHARTLWPCEQPCCRDVNIWKKYTEHKTYYFSFGLFFLLVILLGTSFFLQLPRNNKHRTIFISSFTTLIVKDKIEWLWLTTLWRPTRMFLQQPSPSKYFSPYASSRITRHEAISWN